MALASSSDLRLFGMDLASWPQQWRAAAALLLAHPALRALTPTVRVRLHQANGAQSLWSVAHDQARFLHAQTGSPQVEAIELPPDEALERMLTLPALSQTDLDEAVRLEALSITPFEPEQTLFGYCVKADGHGRLHVNLALTSRARLDALLSRYQHLKQPEIWVLPARQKASDQTLRPIFMPIGSLTRDRLTARGRYLRLTLLALTAILLLAVVATPALQLRQRTLQAQAALTRLSEQVAPQMAKREALQAHADRLAQLRSVIGSQPRLIPALAAVTQALPQSAWVNTLRLEGGKLFISGYAEDAAVLVQLLGKQPGVQSARLASPAVRNGSTGQETFTIEIEFDASLQRLPSQQPDHEAARTPGGSA